MKIRIDTPNKQAAKNFAKWFRNEGFELFIKSKHNKMKKNNPDCYITCLSTDEELLNLNEYDGQYFELE